MRAVVFHDIGDIRLDDVPDPSIEQSTDAIVRLTTSAVCGTDLHMVRGTMPGMEPGTILGHEAVGVVEEVGADVRNLRAGDRVVIPSTIACGSCGYCRAGYHAQCDVAGNADATAFFGGPAPTGPFDGLQAEYARIPFANVGPVRLPDEVADDEAILLSDIGPTGFFGARLAQIRSGDTVAVLGCGPVGQFAIASAFLEGAGRVLAVDRVADRLDLARRQGAEVVDFGEEDPVEVVRDLTAGIGADRVIDAVGVDAESADEQRDDEVAAIAADDADPDADRYAPGSAPMQAAEWSVQLVAKAGTVAIIGVYPQTATQYPIGTAMQRNLTITMGNCNHRKYIPLLLDHVITGRLRPTDVLTRTEEMHDAISAYERFDARTSGWTKVSLDVAT